MGEALTVASWLPLRTRLSVDIAAPADLVFEYVADPQRWDEWQVISATTTRTSTGEWAVGATYEMEFRSGGRRQVLSCEVTDYDPPRRLACSAAGPYLCDAVTSLEESDAGTRVTIETRTGSRSRLKTVLALIGWPLTMWLVRWRGRQQLTALKRAVEGTVREASD